VRWLCTAFVGVALGFWSALHDLTIPFWIGFWLFVGGTLGATLTIKPSRCPSCARYQLHRGLCDRCIAPWRDMDYGF
jgi:hypothetical protein